MSMVVKSALFCSRRAVLESCSHHQLYPLRHYPLRTGPSLSLSRLSQNRLFVNRQFTSNNDKSGSSISESSNGGFKARVSQMWNRFTGPKEMPPRWTLKWYGEVLLICTVFAITGSSTMVLVRPAVSKGLGIQGSLKDGPWSYRICSLVVMTPIYATLLVIVGTIFGRHHYFRIFSVKMWSRFGIPPEMIDPTFHEAKKNFRKW